MAAKLRLTPDQAALFLGKPKFGSKPERAPRKKRKEDLPENQVEKQIRDFLLAHGWQVERQHVGTFVPFRVFAALRDAKSPADRERAMKYSNVVRIGEKGKPDWSATLRLDRGLYLHMEFEVKAPGKQLRTEQWEYIRRAQALKRNAFCWDSFNVFREDYRRLLLTGMASFGVTESGEIGQQIGGAF